MLILSRYPGESIVISIPPSDDVTEVVVTAVRVVGDKVRIGTDAPDEVTIDRFEIYDRKQREVGQ